jgi:2-hydroxy-3-oxopropionate reductase
MIEQFKIGFLGLGIMGAPMVKNLINAEYEVYVYVHKQEAMKNLDKSGAIPMGSPLVLGDKVDVVITMVQDSANSEEAIISDNGVLNTLKKGSTVIDMSSISPLVSQKISKLCEQKGVDFLDAPVSGGEPMAISGDLAIMVGGKKNVFKKFESLFDVLGKSKVYCGQAGAGNTTKLANQIIVAANIEALSEALVLSKKAGLDPKVVLNAIQGGLAGSAVMDAKGPMMADGNFTPGFRIHLHQKDLNNALMTAKELGVSIPVTGLIQQMITSLVNEGKGELDHSGIATFIENISGIKISED